MLSDMGKSRICASLYECLKSSARDYGKRHANYIIAVFIEGRTSSNWPYIFNNKPSITVSNKYQFPCPLLKMTFVSDINSRKQGKQNYLV